MSGRASRSKGCRGEAAAKRLFCERDWEVFASARGESTHDFLALDKTGEAWSCEVKNTCGLALSYYAQCLRNAGSKGRILAWHPSRWNLPGNLWVLFLWPRGERYGNVQVWHANGGGK
jgi:hypothetical protein